MRGARLAALCAALLLAAGCGIRSTDVVQVGDPAYGKVTPSGDEGTTLYFKGPNGLLPVVRSGGNKDARLGGALMQLLNGPSDAEKDAGLTSELPNFYGGLALGVEGDQVTVHLERAVLDFPLLARQQFACTVAHAVPQGQDLKVTVIGTDGRLTLPACPF
ncbi:hypothetical protein [Streptomyces crystallinus]|uniref:Lipoprotein n=1 Tax=Streptomyces crystallinus TaxID=68191 RepID=A0ABN1H4R2_9ACTN